MSNLEGCMITEALSWGCTGVSTAFEANSLGVNIPMPYVKGSLHKPPADPILHHLVAGYLPKPVVISCL